MPALCQRLIGPDPARYPWADRAFRRRIGSFFVGHIAESSGRAARTRRRSSQP